MIKKLPKITRGHLRLMEDGQEIVQLPNYGKCQSARTCCYHMDKLMHEYKFTCEVREIDQRFYVRLTKKKKNDKRMSGSEAEWPI